MAVLFKIVERRNPRDPNAPGKFYVSTKTLGMIGEKEVAKFLSDETTLNHNEAMMAIDQLKKILLRLILNSYSVQLGDWGNFFLTCKSEGTDTYEESSAHKITSLHIRFRPGKEIREALSDAHFLPVESL